jgi:hypothetical protein
MLYKASPFSESGVESQAKVKSASSSESWVNLSPYKQVSRSSSMPSSWLSISSKVHRFYIRIRKILRSPSSSPAKPLALKHTPPPEPSSYPEWPPAPPEELLANPQYYELLFRQQFRYRWPKGEVEDRPLYVLYRLYEHLVLDDNIELRNNIEYFRNHHKWAVADIPDPQGQQPSAICSLGLF